jgi:hypothetical protein
VVEPLSGRPTVDRHQAVADGQQPILDLPVIVRAVLQLEPAHFTHPAERHRPGQIAPLRHRLDPGPHPLHLGHLVAEVQHDAVDVPRPFDRDLVGQHGKHGLVDEGVAVRHAAAQDRLEALSDERECRHRRVVEPVDDGSQFPHPQGQFIEMIGVQRTDLAGAGEGAIAGVSVAPAVRESGHGEHVGASVEFQFHTHLLSSMSGGAPWDRKSAGITDRVSHPGR